MIFAASPGLSLRNQFEGDGTMTTTTFPDTVEVTGAQVWTGRVLSGVAVLFLAMDATMKVLQVPAAVEGTTKLGYPAGGRLPPALTPPPALAAYLTPRPRVRGAILWTGSLGGPAATHVRVGDPLFSH